MLLDVLTNPDGRRRRAKLKVDQASGFAIANVRETMLSQGNNEWCLVIG